MQEQNSTEFVPFSKIPRLSRDIIISEKIDGTNAQILITPIIDEAQIPLIVAHGEWKGAAGDITEGLGLAMLVGSRTRWIRPKQPGEKGDPDNYGFAAWCRDNAQELFKLGVGRHFGEWYGRGINRGYGLEDRRFALFNVSRWADLIGGGIRNMETGEDGPRCCSTVPVLYHGLFDESAILNCLAILRLGGSVAKPGFDKPEGIVIFHTAGGYLFKKTLEGDESPKTCPGLVNGRQLAAGVPAAQHVFEQRVADDKLADYSQNQ